MFRHKILSLVSLLTAFVSTNAFCKPMNVMLILVDDLKPTLGVYGDQTAISPNIDALAKQGMRFDHAYANQAVCMASRYTLMLGSRSTSSGLYNFGLKFRDKYPNALTLPQLFKQAGYHAESMGKVYHIGHGTDDDEASWSVPHHKEKVIDYILPTSNGGEITREEGMFTNANRIDGINNMLRPRGAAWEAPDVLDEAYGDGRTATHAINRLYKLKESATPFFMAVGFARPHLPFTAPKKYWDLYDPAKLPMPEYQDDPKGAPTYAVKRQAELRNYTPVPEQGNRLNDDQLTRQLIHGYYASMSYMDAQVGRVMEGLKATSLDQNTIVVLWGDHGFHLGDHGSWTKHSNYEQATRIPYLIIAPGVTQPGSVSQQLVETVDLYPTLAALTGISIPKTEQPLDGMSLLPVLKDSAVTIRDHAFHVWRSGKHIAPAIRTERYRYVQWTNLKTGQQEEELYDYLNDPLETRNIASQNPEALANMRSILASHPVPAALFKRPKKASSD